ncbi:apolipoprotein N-acyltransferase [Treponema sp. HNW]|uniref:apolipoprotein N-acyltransferase n=1 Tax=Treponema sp. HNW TaxID=3116654 RepID=UPI003D0ED8BB
MRRFLQVFSVIFSAIITAFAVQNEFLPFGSPFLGLFALVPLYLSLSKSVSFKEAGVLNALYMLFTHVLTSFWLGYFKDFAVFTLGATALFYTVTGYFLGTLFFAPFYITRKTALEEKAGLKPLNSVIRIFLFAALWTMYEWRKSTGFLAYPWGTLVMSAWKWKLLTQIVDITGTYGIGFLFSLFNAVVAEGLFLHGTGQKTAGDRCLSGYAGAAVLCCLFFIFGSLYGLYQYTKERIPVKSVSTLLVQPVFDSWLTDTGEDAVLPSIELTQKALDRAQKRPDAVIWSESILTYAFPEAYAYYSYNPKEEPLIPFIRSTGIPFIIGGPVEITGAAPAHTRPNKDAAEGGRGVFSVSQVREFCNSALYFDAAGCWVDFYGKVQLVPFAEVIPYSDKLWMQTLMQSLVGFSSGWTPGKFYTLFDIPINRGEGASDGDSVKVGTPICFEDAFPYVCRNLFFEGSEAFFNLTNDAWSRTKSAEIQHYVIASFRAQEFRTTLVRCTNAGFTSVTDPAGRILYSQPLFESTAGIFDVPIYERRITFYARFGDWLPAFLLFLWILFYTVFYIRQGDKNTCFGKKNHPVTDLQAAIETP